MTSPIAPALRCENLHKTYGRVRAVDGVSLQIAPGQLLALLGPSGCGKTTVLRLLSGFEEPDAGEVWVASRDVTRLPAEQRRVGMVFQEYALFPHLSVAQNIAFGLPKGPHAIERVNEALSLVGLSGLHERMPHELSGGQQQRVALARALAPKPDLILLDEPFSNLDAALRSRVRQDVRQILRQANATALFVTHDQEEALSLADEVAVMLDGRLIQVGSPERLYQRPATRAVATFLGDANFLPGQATGHQVICELGTLPIVESAQGEVEIMFRPEDLLIELDDAGTACIVERDYFGHDQLLRVRLPSGLLLKSRTVGCCRGLREGQRVRIRLETPVIAYPRPFGCPILHTS